MASQFSRSPFRFLFLGRSTAIAPLSLALIAPLLTLGNMEAALGQTANTDRILQLLECLEAFGTQPNNVVLQACRAYGDRPIPSQTTSRAPAPSASAPSPRAQTFTPSRQPAEPGPLQAQSTSTPATEAFSNRASAESEGVNNGTSAPVSDRQTVILGCMTDYGTAGSNRVLNACGAWQPNPSATAAPNSQNRTGSAQVLASGVNSESSNTGGSQSISRSTGGGLGRPGSGAPDRRPLSNPGSSPSGGGSGSARLPAIAREGSSGGASDSGNFPSTPPPSNTTAPSPSMDTSDNSSAEDPPTDLASVGIGLSADARQRGRVSDDFNEERLADLICREMTRDFVRCDDEEETSANNGGGSIGVSAVGGALPLSCDESEATLRTRGVTRVTQGNTSIYVGFLQVSPNNQDPRIARFDNGQQTWCREDYEITGDDNQGYGLVWDGGDRLYAAFTATGTRGTSDQDFRRFATNGWLTSYGAGGGPAVTVLAQITPSNGNVQRATFISALQSNGASNSLRLTELNLDATNVNIRAQSSFSPRRPDRSAFTCGSSVAGFDYTATFTPDLSTVTQAAAPHCS